jgi:hypothetical protein
MAAAAIASGAVPLADPGVAAAGVAVTVTVAVTGIATATGVVAGVLVPFCDAGLVGPFVETEVEASVDEAVVDFVESPFEAEDLVRERGDASVLLLALASEAGPLLASWLAELLLFAGWFAEAELRQRLLSTAEE